MIQDYAVLRSAAEVDQSVPVAERLLARYGAGSVASLSFDKGFTRAEDRELLELYIPTVVMPKRGKKNAAETERENGKKFKALRRRHSAVESEINSLEHHGLNRCLDVGLVGYLRYVGLGVMSYNLCTCSGGSCCGASASAARSWRWRPEGAAAKPGSQSDGSGVGRAGEKSPLEGDWRKTQPSVVGPARPTSRPASKDMSFRPDTN